MVGMNLVTVSFTRGKYRFFWAIWSCATLISAGSDVFCILMMSAVQWTSRSRILWDL